MNDLGVRGIRFNLSSGGGPSQADEIRLLAERIAPLGWSVSFFMDADRITEMEPFLSSLPCDIILDHRAHIPAEQGIHHPAAPVLCRLLEEEHIWIKLSALCIDSVKKDFSDTAAVGKALCRINPDRCLWGSDWPHPLLYESRSDFPNDSDMLDLLYEQVYEQAGDEETFRKILSDNPAKAYGF